jgi:hypothetical protein
MKAAVVLVSVLMFTGCVAQTDSQDDGTAEADPRIATNSMLPSSIAPSNIYAMPLTGTSLANSKLEDTAGHRSFLGYVIDCALTSTQTIRSTYGLNTYNYVGNLGIAPAWTTRALTLDETAYVSACVIARANSFGTAVTLSMRADSASFFDTADELANYNVEEAAFWGNVFSSNPNQMHACNGVDQVRVGDTYGDLPLRQCGQPDPNNPGYTLCGFVFDGNCSDICVRNGDHYTSCGSWPDILTVRLYGTAP